MSDLTPMQRRFCLEYLKDKNATRAAIRAGYSKKWARVEGYRNLKRQIVRDFIRTAIADQESRLMIDGDRVIKELARIAFFDPVPLQLLAQKKLTLEDLTRDERAAISEIVETEKSWTEGRGADKEEFKETTVKAKAHSKQSALDSLAKHFNLFKDDESKGDGPTPVLKLIYPMPGKDERSG